MTLTLLPEYAAAIMAEREADARRAQNMRAYRSLAGGPRPGLGAIAALVWREFLWEMTGLGLPNELPGPTARSFR